MFLLVMLVFVFFQSFWSEFVRFLLLLEWLGLKVMKMKNKKGRLFVEFILTTESASRNPSSTPTYL